MYDPPLYIWAITLAGVTAVPLATSVAIHHGARRAGLGRRRAALIGIASAHCSHYRRDSATYQLISIGLTGAPISGLPLALIPSAEVPLLLALHLTSISALRNESPSLKHRPVRPQKAATR
jgi:hypothetical protein